MSRNATDEQIKRAYRKLALIYHPDRNSAEDAQEVFMIIGRANEVLSNPKSRAEHDFMIDYQNVINITQEINASTYNQPSSVSNQRSDKKYYRTNNGYSPPVNAALNYRDKPVWTMFGDLICYVGIFILGFVIAANLITQPIKSEFVSYKSRTGKVSTTDGRFFGILSQEDLVSINALEQEQKAVNIIRNESLLANFNSSAQVENTTIYIPTIGIYAICFAILTSIFSMISIYFKKRNYYTFIKIVALESICLMFLLIMIL